MNAQRCLFSAQRRFLGNHISAAIAVAAIATVFVYVWSERKSEVGNSQRNLISKGLTYLFHVKPIGCNVESSDNFGLRPNFALSESLSDR